jgi:hypothetical protein
VIEDDVLALHRRIGRALVAEAPSGWERLEMTCWQAARTGGSRKWATFPDGSTTWIRGVDMDFHDAVRELRRALYREGRGTWYTAEAVITRDGRIVFAFDVDGEPQWDAPVVPSTYVEDLKMFPRDLEHQPEWLREKVREAGA